MNPLADNYRPPSAPPVSVDGAYRALLNDADDDWQTFEAQVGDAIREGREHDPPPPPRFERIGPPTPPPSPTFKPALPQSMQPTAPSIPPGEGWAMLRVLLVLGVVVGIAVAAGPAVIGAIVLCILVYFGGKAS